MNAVLNFQLSFLQRLKHINLNSRENMLSLKNLFSLNSGHSMSRARNVFLAAEIGRSFFKI